MSADQVLVPWPAAPLRSREPARVRVRVIGGGAESDWSEPATVEAGLLDADDWTARFVSPVELGGIGAPAPVLGAVAGRAGRGGRAPACTPPRTASTARRSTAAASATTCWRPAGRATHHRLRYQTYDVTELRPRGRQRARGAARQRLVPRPARLGRPARAVRRPAGAARAARGDDRRRRGPRARHRRARGPRARAACSPTTSTTASAPTCGRGAASAPTAWRRSRPTLRRLVAPDGPPVRATRDAPGASTSSARRPARRSSTSARTSSAGCACACAAPSPGTEVAIRHAEVLEDGELGVRPLRTAKATDSYILAGGGDEVLEPSLTFHGFRYAEVSGVERPAREDVEAVVVGSDLRRTGWFSSSDERLDRFHENVVWGMRGNFLDVPTDCPQRDERLGWTGDVQVFAPAATFLFDTAGFLSSWLADLAAEQQRGRLGAVRDPGRARQRRPGRGRLGRRRDARAVGHLPAHRRPRAARAPAPEHARVGRPRSPRSPGRTTCGPAASSSATGSTRPRRRTRRQGPGRPATWSRPPTSPARPRSSRSPPGCVGAARASPSATRGSPTACAARSRASTSPAAAAC